MRRRFKDKDAFIEEASRVHKGKFDYSKVVYKGTYPKIEVLCPIHGSFWVHAGNHINGTGCPKCSGKYRKTQQEFITEVEQKFGKEKFDLSKVVYKNADTKITVGCKEHGFFQITPYSLLQGHGCPKCRYIKMANTRKYPADRFFKKAQEKWGTLFDYSKSNYVDMNTKIEIRCTKHNHIFLQTPARHLEGLGCIHCQTEKYIKSRTMTTEDFISKARKIHKDRFDYSKTQYFHYKKKLIITCPKHGDFWQLPVDHLHGAGCPKCAMSKPERFIYHYLKDNNIPFISQYKIKGCKYKKLLPFDFAIFNKDGSLRCLIEYQGEQHFKRRWYHKNKEDSFEEQLKRDKIKYDFCKSHNIKLNYVTYNENLKHRLDTLLADS